MNKEHFSEDEWKVIGQAVARLRASVMAVTFGIVGGLILGPTGGSEHVGPTLGLLANFFPGYSVTWSGAVVGAFYGALSGAIAGFVLAVIYNRIVIYRRR